MSQKMENNNETKDKINHQLTYVCSNFAHNAGGEVVCLL